MLNNEGHIVELKSTGPAIARIIRNLQPVLEDEEKGDILIVGIVLALTIQNPDLTGEQITEGVRNISQYISMWLSGVDMVTGTGIPKEKYN